METLSLSPVNAMTEYRVRLDCFEGPMDLLVYLIRKNEIDIYDIPIALIADQYLAHIEQLESLNLENAGDFLLMAATLLQIKSRMLLPSSGQEEQFEDPRTELVEKILEYMQYKEIAGRMRQLENSSLHQAERGYSELVELETAKGDPGIEATLNDLILAYGRMILRKPPPEPVHRIVREEFNTQERIEELRKVLARRRKVLFSELITEQPGRLFMIVTLVALLEMAKAGEIVIDQHEVFADLWIAAARKKRKPVAIDTASQVGNAAEQETGPETARRDERIISNGES